MKIRYAQQNPAGKGMSGERERERRVEPLCHQTTHQLERQECSHPLTTSPQYPGQPGLLREEEEGEGRREREGRRKRRRGGVGITENGVE